MFFDARHLLHVGMGLVVYCFAVMRSFLFFLQWTQQCNTRKLKGTIIHA